MQTESKHEQNNPESFFQNVDSAKKWLEYALTDFETVSLEENDKLREAVTMILSSSDQTSNETSGNVKLYVTLEMRIRNFVSKYQSEFTPLFPLEPYQRFLDPKEREVEELTKRFCLVIDGYEKEVSIAKLTGYGPDYIEETQNGKGIMGRFNKEKVKRPTLPEEKNLLTFEVIGKFKCSKDFWQVVVTDGSQIENARDFVKKLQGDFSNRDIRLALNLMRKGKKKEE